MTRRNGGYIAEFPDDLEAFPKGKIVALREPYGKGIERVEKFLSAEALAAWPGFTRGRVVGSEEKSQAYPQKEAPVVYLDMLFDDDTPLLDTARSGECRCFKPELLEP